MAPEPVRVKTAVCREAAHVLPDGDSLRAAAPQAEIKREQKRERHEAQVGPEALAAPPAQPLTPAQAKARAKGR